MHPSVQQPDRQTGFSAAHTCPQLPQFNESVSRLRQNPLQHMESGHCELSLQEPVEASVAVIPPAPPVDAEELSKPAMRTTPGITLLVATTSTHIFPAAGLPILLSESLQSPALFPYMGKLWVA
jgi:hypothetical protein